MRVVVKNKNKMKKLPAPPPPSKIHVTFRQRTRLPLHAEDVFILAETIGWWGVKCRR